MCFFLQKTQNQNILFNFQKYGSNMPFLYLKYIRQSILILKTFRHNKLVYSKITHPHGKGEIFQLDRINTHNTNI